MKRAPKVFGQRALLTRGFDKEAIRASGKPRHDLMGQQHKTASGDGILRHHLGGRRDVGPSHAVDPVVLQGAWNLHSITRPRAWTEERA